jgi:hypothetical protein
MVGFITRSVRMRAVERVGFATFKGCKTCYTN